MIPINLISSAVVALLLFGGIGIVCVLEKDFQMYVFNVGQASSQLIIWPSGYSVLIDAPEVNDTSSETAQMLAQKIRSITGGSHINVAVASSLKLDHIGMPGYGGLWWLIEREGITFDVLVDRDHSSCNDTNNDLLCNESELHWNNIGQVTPLAKAWATWVLSPANLKVFPIRQTAVLGSATLIKPPEAAVSKVVIISTDGIGATTPSGAQISGDHSKDSSSSVPSESDYSIGLALCYAAFSYVTGSDLSSNIEPFVGPRVWGNFDMYEASQYGANSLNGEAVLSALKPQISLISLGNHTEDVLPGQQALDRMLEHGDVYLTARGAESVDYKTAVISNSDIKITATEGTGSTIKITAQNGQYTKSYKARDSSNVCRTVLV